MNNSNRYANGYAPKIAYWYVQAIISENGTNEWRRAMSKLTYFQNKQIEVYGTSDGVSDAIRFALHENNLL